MIKRISILLSLSLYLLLHGGVVLGMHFCGKSVAEIAFSTTEKTTCACKKEKSCCHTKVLVLKTDFDETSTTFEKNSLTKTYAPVLFQYRITHSDAISQSNAAINSFRAPPLGLPAAYLLFHALIFYA